MKTYINGYIVKFCYIIDRKNSLLLAIFYINDVNKL